MKLKEPTHGEWVGFRNNDKDSFVISMYMFTDYDGKYRDLQGNAWEEFTHLYNFLFKGDYMSNNTITRHGKKYLKVEPVGWLNNSTTLKSIKSRGAELVVELETGKLTYLEKMVHPVIFQTKVGFTATIPPEYYDSRVVEFITKHLGYERGVLICFDGKFSTYFDGKYTKHMEILFNIAKDA
jgi:hypothetical protein